MRLFLILFYLFGLSGCVSSTIQTDYLLQNHPQSIPSQARVENVPFIHQETGQCGPATLAMMLNFRGKKISVDEISSQVYTPGMKGTLQTDMISAARRQGLVAVPIENMDSLLKEIAHGNPVIVFENLALSWMPQWHYAVVFGYDLSQEAVWMHSGPEENKKWTLKKLERSWKLGDYWGLVLLSPEQLSATATELEHAQAAVGLEQFGKNDEALIAYKTILTRWPESLSALIGLGNVEFNRKNYKQAVIHLKKATQAHPEAESARHNLKIAEQAARDAGSLSP